MALHSNILISAEPSPAQLYFESLTGWPSVLPEACMQREDWLAFIKLDLSTLPSYERHLAGKNLALAVSHLSILPVLNRCFYSPITAYNLARLFNYISFPCFMETAYITLTTGIT